MTGKRTQIQPSDTTNMSQSETDAVNILFATNNAHKLMEVPGRAGSRLPAGDAPRMRRHGGDSRRAADPRRQRFAEGALPQRPHGAGLLRRRYRTRSEGAGRRSGRAFGPLRHRRTRFRGQQPPAAEKPRRSDRPPGAVPNGHFADPQRRRTPFRRCGRRAHHRPRRGARRLRVRSAVHTRRIRQDLRPDVHRREKTRFRTAPAPYANSRPICIPPGNRVSLRHTGAIRKNARLLLHATLSIFALQWKRELTTKRNVSTPGPSRR